MSNRGWKICALSFAAFFAPVFSLPTLAIAEAVTSVGRPLTYSDQSFIVFQDTEQPGAYAEVVFNNHLNNSPEDLVPSLTHDYVTIQIEFGFNVNGGDDSITVIPPIGFYAEPETIVVMEGFSGTIYIFPQMLS